SIAPVPGRVRPGRLAAVEQGCVGVGAWPLVEPASQAFVWGTPTALTVADVLGTGPQVIVSTTEQLLYRFAWDGSRLVQDATPISDAQLPFSFMTRWRWPGDTVDGLLAHNGGGLGVWRVRAGSL